MVQWVKGLGSSPQSFRLMLRHRFNPQLGNFHMPWVPKKKKKILAGLKTFSLNPNNNRTR